MKRSLVVLCLTALVAVGAGACGGGDDDSGGETSSGTTAKSTDGAVITIKNLTFSGADSVKAGESVTVENEDSTRHTFTPDHTGDFQAAALDGGKSAEIAFEEPGTFAYHCEIHPTMKGTIEVTS